MLKKNPLIRLLFQVGSGEGEKKKMGQEMHILEEILKQE